MRKIFLIMGIALGVLASAGLIYFNMRNRPAVSHIMVAVRDVPAGTAVQAADFRVATWADVDAVALSRYLSPAEFAGIEGRMLLSDVSAGFPLGKNQLDSEASAGAAARLSNGVQGGESYYAVLPVSPDQIGNWVQPNDRIDMLITLGEFSSAADDALRSLPAPLETGGTMLDGVTPAVSLTVMQPTTKLVLQNLRVIRIDREPVVQRATDVRTATGAYATAADDVGGPEEEVRDVKRVYVEVTREQLEILTFVKRSGRHDFAIRSAQNVSTPPTLGLSLSDYVRWFFAQRDNKSPYAVDAMRPAGPYEPSRSGHTSAP